MITEEHVHTLVGRDVHDRDGDRIGEIGQIWQDGAGRPTWASVRTGLFGIRESLVPLQDADMSGGRLTVPYEKSTVKDAPHIDASYDEPLDEDGVGQLYQHYGMSWDDSARAYRAGAAHTDAAAARGADFGAAAGEAPAGEVGGEVRGRDREASGPATTEGVSDAAMNEAAVSDQAVSDQAMTRSEERLRVGAERQPVARARLRKYVVTEQQQITVPVQREEVRLEREPITDAGTAMDAADISDDEHEMTLHAERPVVQTETVPVERVRLGTQTVTESETVAGQVRKEQIDADVPGADRRRAD
jgi:uncharacterized protein (TIGR02271 family)